MEFQFSSNEFMTPKDEDYGEYYNDSFLILTPTGTFSKYDRTLHSSYGEYSEELYFIDFEQYKNKIEVSSQIIDYETDMDFSIYCLDDNVSKTKNITIYMPNFENKLIDLS